MRSSGRSCSLISLRLAHVSDSGAIVASVNTQGPYGEDWIRDGSFLNRMLDENGLTDWVTAHNLFYARVQASPDNPSLLRGMGEKEVKSYARKGILTVTQLAHTFRPRRRGKRAPPNENHHYHALQALALRDEPGRRRPESADVRG